MSFKSKVVVKEVIKSMVRCIDCGHCYAFYVTAIPTRLEFLDLDYYGCIEPSEDETDSLFLSEDEVLQERRCEHFIERKELWRKYWEQFKNNKPIREAIEAVINALSQ
jgi:hypothetical protein